MSQSFELELQKQFKASQEKHRYFLLAASASAIGFAMTQSKAEPLEFIHFPLGIAIGLWALSFVAGLRFVEHAQGFTSRNHYYLAFTRQIRDYQGSNAEQLRAEAKTAFENASTKQNRKMDVYGTLQSWTLLFGAIAYIVWHGLRMW